MGALKVGYVKADRQEASAWDSISRLESAGCSRVVLDSGPRGAPATAMFANVAKSLAPGDILMVTDLHHLAGKLGPVVELLAELQARGVRVQDLSSGLDTADEAAASILRILSDFVRDSSAPQQMRPNGLAPVGRPRRMSSEDIARARKLLEEGSLSMGELVEHLGVSRATLYRNLRSPR